MKKQDEYSSDRDTFLGMFAEIISYLRQLVNKKAKTKNLYDTADVKQLLKASDSTVYRLRKSGKLKFIKIRGRIYYTIASVKKLMKGK
ncbi:helix-turn-helix domain-containing protein [Epilithonimonas mollis]|uniref:Helix-turn-helix domain-containing protein n=1 Tax=Epilithonimonas mollis TaxID=216903 RepID=A0A1M6T7M1_9FLAO|nr:helix-turn-helix domain-containing protein [Epilithonimonas mollis]SHK52987.1 Helix-turn-helix domain-containing protein [Epilithonimonas mollis]